MPTPELKLNLGSGNQPLEGYVNIDRIHSVPRSAGSSDEAIVPRDSALKHEVYPLKYPDECASEVRASHILEHFSHRKTADVVKEWVRVLKPGGCLKIAVPNFAWIANRYVDNPHGPVNFQGYVMGGHTDSNDHHGAIFDEACLRFQMGAAGLVDIEPWASEINDCASLPVSLNLMGFKPGADHVAPGAPTITANAPQTHEEVVAARHPDARFAGIAIPTNAIAGVMTCPRVGFTAFMHCAMTALAPLGIPLALSGGAFWHQGIEDVFDGQMALENPPKYLLACDYDTLFDVYDVQTLYGLMESRPDIGALCPVQMRREHNNALITVRGEDGENAPKVRRKRMEMDVLPVATGHFGLTLIRAECLRSIPKPWFHAKPDPSGGWGEGKTDADIAFWRLFEESGHKLYQANRVVVGHQELMVAWPDQNLETMIQRVSDYHKEGRPAKGSGIWH